METTSFDLEVLPERERMTAWRRSVPAFFEGVAVVHVEAAGAPRGTVRHVSLGGGRVWSIASTAQRVERGGARRGDATSDFFNVLVQLQGTSRVTQAGRECELAAGQFAWVDGREPFAFEMPGDFSQRLVQLPRATVLSRHPDLVHRVAVASRPEDAGDALLLQVLDAVARSGPSLDDAQRVMALGSVVELAGAAEAGRARVPDAGAWRVRRALADIEAELDDPELSAERVASRQGVSRRYLDGLLAPLGTSLTARIWERRLERAAEALRAPARAREGIFAIALDCGFRDAAHFTRAFRRRYGVTPRRWRGGQ
jgi:AraC-like DNA-binding protein